MSVERKQINLRVSLEFLAQLEEVRGLVPREAWMREVLRAEVTRVLRERAKEVS